MHRLLIVIGKYGDRVCNYKELLFMTYTSGALLFSRVRQQATSSLVPSLLPSCLLCTVCDKKLGRRLGTTLGNELTVPLFSREHFGDDIVGVEKGKKENRAQESFDVSMREFLDVSGDNTHPRNSLVPQTAPLTFELSKENLFQRSQIYTHTHACIHSHTCIHNT